MRLRSAVPATQVGRGNCFADAAGELVVLVADRAGEVGAEGIEEGFLALDRLGPFIWVDAQELGDRRVGEVEAAQVERRSGGYVADRGVGGAGARPVGALEDPLEHAQVLAVARPEELAVVARAEPVHPEDLRRRLELLADLEPVP